MNRGATALTTVWPRPAQSAGPTLPAGGLTRQGSLTTSRPLRPSSPNVPKSPCNNEMDPPFPTQPG